MLVGQGAADDEASQREQDADDDQGRPEPAAARCARGREPARIRGVHAGQPTAPSPLSRKTSGRVGRPHLPVAFNTP